MATRDDLYEQFGPKMIEALVNILLDEINVLRVAVGKSERTKSQMVARITSELATIPDYEGMGEAPDLR